MAVNMRSRILRGAAMLFNKHGGRNVKIEEISSYLGISKKTIYNHFPDKQTLLDAAMDESMRDISRKIDEIADKEIDYFEKVKELMEFAFAEITSREELFLKTLYEDSLDSKLLQFIRQKVLQISAKMAKEGIAAGVLRHDLPKAFLPYFYVNVIEGCILLFRFPDVGITREKMFTESIRITMEGVLTQQGRDEMRKLYDAGTLTAD